MKKIFVILSCGILFLTACGEKPQKKVETTAKENLQQTVDYPEKLKILGVSKVDSAFGINYYTQQEINGMLKIMKSATDKIMSRTNKMTTFDPNDTYVIGLAERQMKATNEIRSMMFQSSPKGAFSGWKIRIDYQCNDKKGIEYKAERWFLFSKDGQQVLKTFELPLI